MHFEHTFSSITTNTTQRSLANQRSDRLRTSHGLPNNVLLQKAITHYVIAAFCYCSNCLYVQSMSSIVITSCRPIPSHVISSHFTPHSSYVIHLHPIPPHLPPSQPSQHPHAMPFIPFHSIQFPSHILYFRPIESNRTLPCRIPSHTNHPISCRPMPILYVPSCHELFHLHPIPRHLIPPHTIIPRSSIHSIPIASFDIPSSRILFYPIPH
jgi:hypothetical protein